MLPKLVSADSTSINSNTTANSTFERQTLETVIEISAVSQKESCISICNLWIIISRLSVSA